MPYELRRAEGISAHYILTHEKSQPSQAPFVKEYEKSGTTGFAPEAGVILDSAGNIYGTTSLGGDLNDCEGEGCGVVFKLTP